MTQTSDELISSYLGRLRAACWPLGEERTAELVEGIEEHIRDAVGELGDDPTTVGGILERLGPPERIAQEASDQPPPVGPVLLSKPSMAREVWTVLLLGVGGFLFPFFTWVVGVVLLVTGKRWLWWEKLLGVLIVPGGPLGGIILLSMVRSTHSSGVKSCVLTDDRQTCTVSGHTTVWSGLSVALVAVALLGPLLVSAFLWFRAKGRAALERPQLVPLSYAAPA